MTEQRIRDLRAKAEKARQFAQYANGDERLVANLESYSKQLEDEALKLERVKEAEPLSPQAMEATHEPPTTESMAALKIEGPKEPEMSELAPRERAERYRAQGREARIKATKCFGDTQAEFIRMAGHWEQLALEAEAEATDASRNYPADRRPKPPTAG